MLDSLAQSPENTSVASSEANTSQPQPQELKPPDSEAHTDVKPPEANEHQPETQHSAEAALTEQVIADRLAQQAKEELQPPVIPQKPEARPAPIALNQERMGQGSPTKGPLTGELISLQHRRRIEFAARHGQPEQTERQRAA